MGWLEGGARGFVGRGGYGGDGVDAVGLVGGKGFGARELHLGGG